MRSLRSGRAVGAALALVLVILVTGSASAAELTPVEQCTRDGFPVTPTAFGKSRGSRFTTVAGWVFLDGSTPVVGARVEIVSRGRPLRLRARTSTRTGPGGAFLVAVPKLPASAQLVARGGRVRGKAFRGPLRATLGGYTPGASLYVNPASTLVTAYLSAFPKRTPARAAAAVRRFLGLPSGTNITVDLQSSSTVFSASTFLARSRGNVNGLLIRLARALREGKVRRFQGARGLPAAPTLRSDSVADDLTIWFVKQLANGAVSKLGGSGMGWVMSQYGIEDGIEGQVRRLSQQLERIDQQLTALSTQVRVLIAKVNELYLANLAKDLDDARSLIKSRMDDLMWVANMSGETPPPDRKELEQETCEKLRLLRPLAEGTTSFGYAELKINGAFFPQGSGSKSLTEAGSLVVGDKYGHWWTLGASAEMRALVDYWTAVQADWLALRLEWDHAAKPCTMANPTVNSCEALRWTTRYRSDSAAETDSAPVLEPSNTWIDRATGLMWAPASYDPMRDWQLTRSGSMRSVFGDPQRGPGWNVWYNSSLPTNCTDYAVVICAIEGKGRNGSQFGGLTDWGAPTEPQITALVAGYKIKPYYRPYDLLIGKPPFGPGLPRAWLEGMGTPRVLTKTCKTSSDVRDLPRWECVIDYLGEERAPYENVNITAAGYLLVRKPARVSDYTAARLSGGPYRYVATNGNDTNNTCTSYVLPCKTLARALDQANSGDVIRLGGGTFTGGVTVSKSVTISGNGARPDDDLGRRPGRTRQGRGHGCDRRPHDHGRAGDRSRDRRRDRERRHADAHRQCRDREPGTRRRRHPQRRRRHAANRRQHDHRQLRRRRRDREPRRRERHPRKPDHDQQYRQRQHGRRDRERHGQPGLAVQRHDHSEHALARQRVRRARGQPSHADEHAPSGQPRSGGLLRRPDSGAARAQPDRRGRQ